MKLHLLIKGIIGKKYKKLRGMNRKKWGGGAKSNPLKIELDGKILIFTHLCLVRSGKWIESHFSIFYALYKSPMIVRVEQK